MKIRPNYVNPLTMIAEKTAQRVYQLLAPKDGETGKVAELQTKHQQLQNQMLLLQATGTDSAGTTAETRKAVEAELEKVAAELRSIKGSSVQAVEHVSVELKVAKPRMDEYAPEEKQEPFGRYWMGKEKDGKPKIYFENPERIESTPEEQKDISESDGGTAAAEEDGSEKNVKRCTVSTDKVDREIEKLKKQKQELEQRLNRETDETKVKDLEDRLAQIEKELSQKDNDTYRRQHATYTFS